MAQRKASARTRPKIKSAGARSKTALQQFEGWLRSRLDWVVVALIGGLFCYQVQHAASVHLNPDEALIYQLAHQHSWHDAYLASLTNAHPPLFFLLLHGWMTLGNSEVVLRLLPILAYGGFLWFTYCWAGLVFDAAVALAATVIVAFALPIFRLATEVRAYDMLLCFIAAAMWAMERAFQAKGSRRDAIQWVAMSAVLLWLAILTHYSAMWFTLAFGIYCVLRILRRALPGAAIAVWMAGQAVALGICAFLYVTHISVLLGAAITKEAREGWLRQFYRLPGDSVVQYLITNSWGVFQFLFASRRAAILAGVLFLAGCLALLWIYKLEKTFLILLPLAIFATAGAIGLSPYGGSRHTVMLTPFLVVPIAIAIAVLANRKVWLVAVILSILTPLCLHAALPEPQVLPEERQKRELILDAVSYLRSVAPPGSVVFAEYQSSLLLCYYYDPGRYCINEGGKHFWNYSLGGIRVGVVPAWVVDAAHFPEELKEFKKEYAWQPGKEIWVFEAGWTVPMHRGLISAGAKLAGLREFGDNIAVFRVPD